MAEIDGVKLSNAEIYEHLKQFAEPLLEYELGQTIYYMEDSKVHSAPCSARMYVDNAHEDWASTLKQKEAWTPFGPAGTYYSTCHGIVHADKVFGSKEELLESL